MMKTIFLTPKTSKPTSIPKIIDQAKTITQSQPQNKERNFRIQNMVIYNYYLRGKNGKEEKGVPI